MDAAAQPDQWPGSHQGIGIAWVPAETTLVFEMCAFLGYQDGDPGLYTRGAGAPRTTA